MDPTRIGLFELADKRLGYIEARQSVLAANIANADTPGWRAKDLPDFARMLGSSSPGLARTDGRHISGSTSHAARALGGGKAESAPDGNAVALDDQLEKVAETDAAHELVGDLYRKYLGLFRVALGR